MEKALSDKFGPIRKGLLEFAVMRVVEERAVYAADIIERLAATEFATGEGTLYPLLSKMRREELLEYEWQESGTGPPRKYYRLTAKGRAELKRIGEYWELIIKTLESIGT